MNIKKGLIVLFCIVFLSSLIMAQDYKLGISTIPKDKIFEAGKNITLIVNLYDSQNHLINEEVSITLEDAEKNVRLEKKVQSNNPVSINLVGASYGQGKITAKYKDTEATGFFIIEINELAKFELDGDKLIITNIGNTKYTRTVQVTIGETTGVKEPRLNVGNSISYRLVAPEGVYNIKITDGKTVLEKNEIRLTGTGEVIGALDERSSQGSSITGISPDEESEGELSTYLGNNKFIYIFVLAVFGAMILLAIERRYRKKASE